MNRSSLASILVAGLVAAPAAVATEACDQLTLRYALENPDAEVRDLFGYAVAATGNIVAIGAKQDNPQDVPTAGTVYVYDQRTGGILWTIENPFPQAADHFGDRLAFVGTKLIVGAHFDDTKVTAGGKDTGAVYLFSTNSGSLLHTYYSPAPQNEDLFGFAVAGLGTNRIVVGAHQADHDGLPDAGAVYVYSVFGTNPITTPVLPVLHAPDAQEGDNFGIAVATVTNETGSYIIVGAHHRDVDGNSDAGVAYVFDGVTGAYLRTLQSPAPVADGRFGWAVASVGDSRVVVGAFGEGAGAAYLFDVASGDLLQTYHSPTAQTASEFGFSVGAVGDDVLVGAPEDGASREGRAYLFDGDGAGTLLKEFDTTNPGVESDFGYSVAGAGSHNIAIGAPRDDRPFESSCELGAGECDSGYAFLYGGCSAINGSVYRDLNNDGFRLSTSTTFRERGISGVRVTLTGTDALGNPVAMQTNTNTNGYYYFAGLVEGTYEVTERQPSLYLDGKDSPGLTPGANVPGTIVANDHLAVDLPRGTTANKFNFGELPQAKLAGFVYADNDASSALNTGDTGIGGVTVTLTGTDDLGTSVSRTTTTAAADGSYSFGGLRPGVYALTETQPDGYDDGAETIGTSGGSSTTNDVIDSIDLSDLTGKLSGKHYDFGELVPPVPPPPPASLCGYVWFDADNDGLREPANGEFGIGGVTVNLTGTESATTTTASDGHYCFNGLDAGTYTVTESQPAGYADGQDAVGSSGGTLANDQISAVGLDAGENATGYDFGERGGGSLDPRNPGYTGTIGYWQNQNGQEIILGFNGDGTNACPTCTQLGYWLAETWPAIYGASTGVASMAGKTNQQIADYYKWLFKNAPEPKVDVQFMCGAFGVYATTLGLGGNGISAGNGFVVAAWGTAQLTINVGASGPALGVPAGTIMTVAQIYNAVNAAAANGTLYNGDPELRELANRILTAINEQGDIR